MRRLLRACLARLADMKMKRKVIVTYIILSILPVACLNLFTYQYTKRLLLEREARLAADSINQAAMQVDSRLQLYDTLSNYIFNDAKILAAVNDSYGDQYFQMYKAYEDMIVPLFRTYYFLHPDLMEVTIYTGSDLHPYGNFVRPLSRLREEAWYPQVADRYQPAWLLAEEDGHKALVSARRMFRRWKDDHVNYLYMELDYQSFFAPLSTITSDGYGLAVVDEQGALLYSFASAEGLPDPATFAGGVPPGLADRYMITSTTIHEGMWSVYCYRPLSAVTASVTGVIQATFLILWLVLLLLGGLAWVFSGVIVSPLEKLTRNMRQVQQGDMKVTVHTERRDEIGVLIRSFSDMMDRINELIRVVYRNEIEKKEYQLKVLRAQINPHFLYNSLSLINSRAIVAGQEEISKMALYISSFYRTALNHGQDITTVENELANTRAYLSVQLLLSGDSFAVEYDIDSDVLALQVPHFILQPIVENAVGHGLLDSPSPDRRLRVSAGLREGRICLEVEDNGVGIPEEKARQLLQNRSEGYGMRNVDERLALLYGEHDHFRIDSEVGRGTRITLLLEKRLPGPGGENAGTMETLHSRLD